MKLKQGYVCFSGAVSKSANPENQGRDCHCSPWGQGYPMSTEEVLPKGM